MAKRILPQPPHPPSHPLDQKQVSHDSQNESTVGVIKRFIQRCSCFLSNPFTKRERTESGSTADEFMSPLGIDPNAIDSNEYQTARSHESPSPSHESPQSKPVNHGVDRDVFFGDLIGDTDQDRFDILANSIFKLLKSNPQGFQKNQEARNYTIDFCLKKTK